ncbi:MAG TPA: site-specific DNA-methyltransferase [Bdellovibrionota bacterium]|nr:site-specific DNA-methyltransferase [Bdellovibrionota bacterium]
MKKRKARPHPGGRIKSQLRAAEAPAPYHREPVSNALDQYIPADLLQLGDTQTGIPKAAKDPKIMARIGSIVAKIPTRHVFFSRDARSITSTDVGNVHLVLTSPPYWTLKEYRSVPGQLGHVEDYEQFLDQLDRVWRASFDALVPGGRVICVVGDVCLSRRKNNGRHSVVPLHSSIQERARKIGFDNLAPIIWHKIANAVFEVSRGGGFLGKPYEPNAVIKNDIEFILMLRKPGGYRTPTAAERVLSVISDENHRKWFQQIWTGVTGASTRDHPAPYPFELAERLVRMFSFVGDTILDPFMGTGTTNIAAARWGRNSIGFEIDPHYLKYAETRFHAETETLFSSSSLMVVRGTNEYREKAERGHQDVLDDAVSAG